MRALFIIMAVGLALTGCKPLEGLSGADQSTQLPLVGQEKQDVSKFNCLAKGGSWAQYQGGYFCQHRTKDGGKFCRSGSDCEGVCLARSQSCAPVKPLQGCNDILTEAGYPMNACVN
ncbi:hypothetical protein [Thioclava indica]|uniref:Uncharacterized protein n=1 Tax=Thioclava indica TaxID=1353528 RepID=A0A074JZC8_9RHOB|nr:hypothetical protein [Thioclava indica]KEO60918.1 hypothetical protein DT23_11915 [Thioclava indica]